jgi:hypothetical protein
MTLVELGVLYLVVGVGAAAATLVRRRALLDALLLVPFWPLLAPFQLMRDVGVTEPRAGADFLAALEQAARTPLGPLLPAPHTMRLLAERLAVASAKVAEIDGVLARREFDLEAAQAELTALRARDASDLARTSAAMRVQNIHRLARLRDRFARELDDVRALLVQLETQVEVVRLAGTPDATAAELIHELLARVEGLDQVLDDGAAAPAS